SNRDLFDFYPSTIARIVLDRLEIELDRFPDVPERLFPRVALADAARKARYVGGIAAVLARLQYDAQLHDLLLGFFALYRIFRLDAPLAGLPLPGSMESE